VLSSINKFIVILLAFVCFERANAAGDQSGLLATLYNTKLDYDMYLNKGAEENASLSTMLTDIYNNFQPDDGQQIQMSEDWPTPIRTTVSQFNSAFATEDGALNGTLTNIDNVGLTLKSAQDGSCDAVSARYASARQEMMRIWNQRKQDSNNLLNELNLIVNDTANTGGLFMIQPQWLAKVAAVRDQSDAARAQYTIDLKALDAQWVSVINDIRSCFQID